MMEHGSQQNYQCMKTSIESSLKRLMDTWWKINITHNSSKTFTLHEL